MIKYFVSIILIAVSIAVLSGTSNSDAIKKKNIECSKFKITNHLIDIKSARGMETEIESIYEGKLFHKDISGNCIPTVDTYLVGMLDNGELPRILSVLDGHTPKLDIQAFDNNNVLLVYYFAGGNQFVLTPYEIKVKTIKTILSPPLASNIRNIELVSNQISVKNQEYTSGGEPIVKAEYYEYKNNSFVLVKK